MILVRRLMKDPQNKIDRIEWEKWKFAQLPKWSQERRETRLELLTRIKKIEEKL